MGRLFRRFGGMLLLFGFGIGNAAMAADAVVSTCTDAAFGSAFNTVNGSGGGTITFTCAGTITFSTYRQVSADVVIDGGNKVVFDGNGASAFFQVYSGQSLTLKGLVMQHGADNGDGVLDNFGSLTLDTITLQNNHMLASAIYNSGGTVNIVASTLSYNNINGTSSQLVGTVIRNIGGTVVVSSSTFSHNNIDSTTDGSGGVISNESGGSLYVSYSDFSSNGALYGGAIFGDGAGIIHIAHSTFTGNTARYGGAIASYSSNLTLEHNTFTSNQAAYQGGAVLSGEGTVFANWDEFDNNTSVRIGGAIHCEGDNLYVYGSTFKGNQSGVGSVASANHGGAIYNACYMKIKESTFYQNKALGTGSAGGAVYSDNGTYAGIYHSTIAGNEAGGYGSGVANDGSASMRLFGSILVGNTQGFTCAGDFLSSGYNLADDMDCGGALDGTGDNPDATLPMGPLDYHDSSTRTMLPTGSNPAIDYIPAAICTDAGDQRGATRPANGKCDSGAVEVDGIIDVIFRDGCELP